MTDESEMTLGTALVLHEVVQKILLTKSKDENGQEVWVDRMLPFKVRYALNRNRMILENDYNRFNEERMFLLAKYGHPTEDEQNVTIDDPEALELYRKAVGELVDTKVKHEFYLAPPDDLLTIEDDDISVSPQAMTLFIGYMTNDPKLKEDIEMNVNVTSKELESKEEVKEESKTVDKPAEIEDNPEVKPEPKKKVVKVAKTTKTETTKKPRKKKETK